MDDTQRPLRKPTPPPGQIVRDYGGGRLEGAAFVSFGLIFGTLICTGLFKNCHQKTQDIIIEGVNITVVVDTAKHDTSFVITPVPRVETPKHQ